MTWFSGISENTPTSYPPLPHGALSIEIAKHVLGRKSGFLHGLCPGGRGVESASAPLSCSVSLLLTPIVIRPRIQASLRSFLASGDYCLRIPVVKCYFNPVSIAVPLCQSCLHSRLLPGDPAVVREGRWKGRDQLAREAEVLGECIATLRTSMLRLGSSFDLPPVLQEATDGARTLSSAYCSS